MKNVGELAGAELAYWVAKAEKVPTPGNRKMYFTSDQLYVETPWGGGEPFEYRPDSRWGHCGPMIEKYQMLLESGGENGAYIAQVFDGPLCKWLSIEGSNAREAICRVVVMCHYGENVEDQAR